MTHTTYIALGSNLGDRDKILQDALAALRSHPKIEAVRASSFIETTPVGGPPGQTAYLNAAAELRTSLSPRELLNLLLSVERDLGRVRGERHGPRLLDLDLLLYGDQIIDEPDLLIPHPRMHERWFVLAPLAEIAPDVIHPRFGRSISALLKEVPKPADVAESATDARPLFGRWAVVTGSTSGIGRAIALELADAGANIVVHGRREEAALSVRHEIASRNVECEIALADLGDEAGLTTFVDDIWRRRPVHIWVNNAGADTLTGEAAQWSFAEKWRALWTVDVQATIMLSRLIGERMKQQGHGVILNMGWDQAETGMEGDSGQLFAATKAAVMAFSKSLALTLAPEVRVNCIAPGWIRTAWGEQASAAWQKRAVREAPLQRWGTPEDVARTARWLASPEAGFITGQVIRVNGGAVR